ncbi:hypothetical protein [Dysosmobacter sp.]
MDEQELPLGLGMALAQRPEAMERFALLPEAERQALIQGAHQVRSRQEMQAYVEKLLTDESAPS